MGRHKKQTVEHEPLPMEKSNLPELKTQPTAFGGVVENFQVPPNLPPNLEELKTLPSNLGAISPEIQNAVNSALKMELAQSKLCTPPFVLKRNIHGLLENLDYKFNENGFVDWRAMIPSKYLYFNNNKTEYLEKKYGKKVSEINLAVDKIEDEDLQIRSGGYRWLAGIRKFNSVKYTTITAAENYYATKCQIEWSPNYETDGKPVIFEGLAATSYINTTGYGKNYLAETAENRAFCRCVRNFLNISIVSQEELSEELKEKINEEQSTTQTNPTSARGCLQDVLTKSGKTINDVRDFLVLENYKDANKIESLEDISSSKIWELIEVFKNPKEDSKV